MKYINEFNEVIADLMFTVIKSNMSFRMVCKKYGRVV